MTERVVILGGGTGGVVLANALADRLATALDAGDVTVTLINDGPDHVYKPVWLYVPFGKREPADGRRPLEALVDDRVRLTIDRATAIDTDRNHVALREDPLGVSYDQLVVATGATLQPAEIPGLETFGHDYYSASGSMALRDELLEFTGGRVVVSVIGMPHMCPAAPLEFVFMLDDWLTNRGLRDAVDITYTYPVDGVHANSHIHAWAAPRLDDRDIDTRTGFDIEAVDPETGVVTAADGASVEADLLVSIPPHRGVELLTEAGLGARGWVAVDDHTLEATHADDVYAIGDAAATGVPKAGSVAHYQAGVVSQRIASRVRGRPATATYDGKTLCFIETGMDTASFVAFDYEHPPAPAPPSTLLHWSKLAYNESYWLTARGLL